ncbi:MAG: hypothetical protein ACPHK8_06395 [Thermoplasmatota archaeon]
MLRVVVLLIAVFLAGCTTPIENTTNETSSSAQSWDDPTEHGYYKRGEPTTTSHHGDTSTSATSTWNSRPWVWIEEMQWNPIGYDTPQNANEEYVKFCHRDGENYHEDIGTNKVIYNAPGNDTDIILHQFAVNTTWPESKCITIRNGVGENTNETIYTGLGHTLHNKAGLVVMIYFHEDPYQPSWGTVTGESYGEWRTYNVPSSTGSSQTGSMSSSSTTSQA